MAKNSFLCVCVCVSLFVSHIYATHKKINDIDNTLESTTSTNILRKGRKKKPDHALYLRILF